MSEIPHFQLHLSENENEITDEHSTELDATVYEIAVIFNKLVQQEPEVMAVHKYKSGHGLVSTMREVMPVIFARKELYGAKLTPVEIGYPNQISKGTHLINCIELLRHGAYQSTTYSELSALSILIEDERLPEYIKNVNQRSVVLGNDGILFEGFKDKDSERSIKSTLTNLRRSVAAAAINILAKQSAEDEETARDKFITWLTESQQTMPIIDKVEQRCKIIIRDHERKNAMVAISAIKGIEHQDLSTFDTDKHPILTNPSMLANYPDIAELLQARLVKERADARDSKQEQMYLTTARDLILELLKRYQSDQSRHSENIRKVREFIFPEPKRPNTMSRERLIGLANHVNQSQGIPQKYSSDEMGVVGPALKDVLKITRAGTKAEQEAQSLEDQLYCTVIGMLLEQRHVELEDV